jgi:protein Tex
VSATTFETWFRVQHPAIALSGALSTLKLAREGASVPFMARYRKEQTGSLDEVALQNVLDAKERWDHIVGRQKFIVEQLERQKQLTPELQEKLLATFDSDALEDLYLPFKQKRKTKAALAREAGLQPLADWIWNCAHGTDKPLEGQTLELWAYTFRNPEKDIADVAAVLQGAQDILTERLAEMADLRQTTREVVFRKGCLRTTKGEKAKPSSKYERYFDYIEPIQALLKPEHSHRYLAIRRGWTEGELGLALAGPKDDAGFDERLAQPFEAAAVSVPDAPGAAVLLQAARLALRAYVLTAIETEVHRELKRVADEAAIKVFAENLRNLLLASPFGAKAVLGVDPGVRTGCKLALVDDSGQYTASEVLQLNTEEGRKRAKGLLAAVLEKLPVQATAVGNGTAGRETETFLRQTLRELGRDVPVVMVSEAGASVYSASPVAREEFPALDVTVRGAISIARRLQDPLAELVKVEPKSIGVGQYQHDIAAGALKKSLEQVVDSCVNQVGVNLNTASRHLLAHVSGLGPSLAKAVVEHRAEKGLFRSRQQLLEVPRFSRKAFEQAAGFLRIPGGEHPLDNTGVHPERYAALEGLARKANKDVQELLGSGVDVVKQATELKQELGEFTFADVVQELEKPGRDPRERFVPFAYRDDVHELKDLKPGMTCPGIVTNVTNFGAFVDIGVHQDGLVHVSQVSDRFVKDPHEVVRPGMRVEVRVLEVNLEKSQIALSMKRADAPAARRSAKAAGPKGPRPARDPRAKRPRPAAAPPQRAARPAGKPRPETPRTPRPAPAAPPVHGGGHKPTPPPSARPPQPRGRERAPERSALTTRPGHVPLNNPFAVLADLKKQLKPR